MGGKGYKSYTSLTGKKVSGDWEDSDRGAGNKAKRRAGGDVEAKSPTYQAHVINKGKKKVDPKKNPAVKEDKLAESDVPRNSMGKPIRIKDKIKAAKGFIPHKGKPTNEDFIGEVNSENDNPDANVKKIDVMKGKNKIKINPNVGEQVQVEPNKKVDPSIEKKQQRVSMMKRQILQKKMQAVRSGGGADIVAHNEPKGEMVEAKKKGLDGKECWDGYKLSGTKKKGGKTVDNCVKVGEEKVEKEDPRSMGTKYRNIKNRLRSMGIKFVGPASRLEEEDKAFNYVLAKLKKKHGDGVLTKRDKIKPQSSADKAKVRAHQAKVDKENAAARAKDPSQGRYPKG